MTPTKSAGLQAVWGSGFAAALAAVAVGAAALTNAPALDSLPESHDAVLTTSIGAIVVAVVSAVAAGLLPFRRSQAEDITFAANVTGSILTLCVVVAVPVVADRLAENRDVVRLLDTGSSALLALISACCAAAACICVLIATIRSGPDGAQALCSVGRSAVSGAMVVLCLCAAVTTAVVLTARPALDLEQSTAAATSVAPVPDSIDSTAFRARLDTHRDTTIASAGAGFVLNEPGRIAAYDGRTGGQRWTFDTAAIGGDSKPEVYGTGDDEVVVIPGRRLTVGLDAMTGAVRWRSASTDSDRGSLDTWQASITSSRDDDFRVHRELTVMDPTNGRLVRRTAVPCESDYAVGDHFLIRQACDSPTDFVLTELATGTDRRVTASPTVDWKRLSLWKIGPDMFAAKFEVSHGEDRPEFVAVIDATAGSIVDRFETPETRGVSQFGDGQIAMVHEFDGIRQEIVLRDVSAHSTSRIPVGPASVFAPDLAWVDGGLAAFGSSETLIIDPVHKTVDRRGGVCTPSGWDQSTVTSVVPVPGSFVVFCTGLDYSSFTSELVGLN